MSSAVCQDPFSLLPLPPPLHPKQLALGVIFSLFGNNKIKSYKEGREDKKAQGVVAPPFPCTPCVGSVPVQHTQTHTVHWDLQQSGSVHANDPISLHADRQDMSKPTARKEVKLWANVLENEFQKSPFFSPVH